jgi:hypothetical protein
VWRCGRAGGRFQINESVPVCLQRTGLLWSIKKQSIKEVAMASRDGEQDKTWFRSDRFFCEDGNWFFTTREGTVQGPFDSRADAEQELMLYLRDRRELENFGLADDKT